MTRAAYLERYVTGEREQVWAELQALGGAVRAEPLYTDALAVARETMRRVRHNIETLIPRLEAAGYVFGYRWAEGRDFPSGPPLPMFTPPTPHVHETIAALEHRAGALPLSLRAFYEIVGGVNFVGEPPAAWAGLCSAPEDLDALFVYPAEVALEDVTPWQEAHGDVTDEEWDLPSADDEDLCDSRAYFALPRDCWLVAIAPDEWHKYDMSGCGGYEIALPNQAADARLLTERHRTTFVNYLRTCFRWAGFPKLEQVPHAAEAASICSSLTRDLLPI